MASGNVSSYSSSQLNCLLCLQKFKNPRVLPCLHSFCEKCLGDYIEAYVRNQSEKIICPVCKEKWNPPSFKVAINKWASSFALNDIFVSIMKSEDEREDSAKMCEPCKFRDEEVNAKFWCPNCRENLCGACLRYHSQNVASRHHKTVPIEEMDTSSNFILNYNHHCICDRGHTVDMFCVDHKEMCCCVCSSTTHRGCKEMRDLDQAGKEFVSGNMAANILRDVEKIIKNLKQFQNIRQTNATSFQSDYDKCNKDMDDVCNEIKKQIDTFQTTFRKTAKEIREEVESNQRKNQENLLRFSTNVENSNHVFEIFHKHGDPKQNFTAYDTVISQLNSHYNQLKNELAAEQDVRLYLEVNKVFQEFQKMTTTLGKINTSSTPSSSASNFVDRMDDTMKTMATRTQLNSVVCAAQIARPSDSLSRCMTHIRSVTQREITGGGMFGAYFLGGTSLPNGHLIMADLRNNRLVEFDTSHDMVMQYEVDGRPRDVTSLGHDVYMCVLNNQTSAIYQCRLDGGLTVVRQITAPDNTHRLTVSQDGTLVIGTPDSVQVWSPSGKLVHSIPTPGGYWSYVAVSRTMFYYRYDDAVVCRSLQDGKHLYTYRRDNLKGPEGMCVGDTGTLYVSCYESRNLHEISPDGGSGRVLLDSIPGITHPQAVLYNPYADQIVVTSYRSPLKVLLRSEDTVMAVYKLK